jgi:hypothetical protein
VAPTIPLASEAKAEIRFVTNAADRATSPWYIHEHRTARLMIVFGIFLLICAALNPHLRVLGGIGVLCIIIGLILEILGTIGYAVGNRRHYY